MPKTIYHPVAENEVVKADWGELTWFASAALKNSKDMTIGKCVIKPGRQNPRHMHPNCSEILVVVEGLVEHVMEGGEPVKMYPGDTMTVEPDFFHYATNIGDRDAVMFIAFSSAHREARSE
ncbi:MAG: cupin domain-containing protein [Deltaproteobacteria bacterium]|nr:cupin domain-containing protein [Deltaproteobacteria bacterium]